MLLRGLSSAKVEASAILFLCVKDLQDDIQNHATSFASVVKDTEGFLEENQTKLSPDELTALQEKLHQAKEQYEALQERTKLAQKELEEVVTSALQQETEKVTRLLWCLVFFKKHLVPTQIKADGLQESIGLRKRAHSGADLWVDIYFYKKHSEGL